MRRSSVRPARRPRSSRFSRSRVNTGSRGIVFLYEPDFNQRDVSKDSKRLYVYGRTLAGSQPEGFQDQRRIAEAGGNAYLVSDSKGQVSTVNFASGNAFPIRTDWKILEPGEVAIEQEESALRSSKGTVGQAGVASAPDVKVTLETALTYFDAVFDRLTQVLDLGIDIVWPAHGLTGVPKQRPSGNSNNAQLWNAYFDLQDQLLAYGGPTRMDTAFDETQLTGPRPKPEVKAYTRNIRAEMLDRPRVPIQVHPPAVPTDLYQSLISDEDGAHNLVLLPMNIESLRMASIAQSIVSRYPEYRTIVQRIVKMAADGENALEPHLGQRVFREGFDNTTGRGVGSIHERDLYEFLANTFTVDDNGYTKFIDNSLAARHGDLLAAVNQLSWNVAATRPEGEKSTRLRNVPLTAPKYLPLGLQREYDAVTPVPKIGILEGVGLPDAPSSSEIAQLAEKIEGRSFDGAFLGVGDFSDSGHDYSFVIFGTGDRGLGLPTGGVGANRTTLTPISDDAALAITQPLVFSSLVESTPEGTLQWAQDAKVIFGVPGPLIEKGKDVVHAHEFIQAFQPSFKTYSSEGYVRPYDGITINLSFNPNGQIVDGFVVFSQEGKPLSANVRGVSTEDGQIILSIGPGRDRMTLAASGEDYQVRFGGLTFDARFEGYGSDPHTYMLPRLLERGVERLADRAFEFPHKGFEFLKLLTGSREFEAPAHASVALRNIVGASNDRPEFVSIHDLCTMGQAQAMNALRSQSVDSMRPDLGTKDQAVRADLEKLAQTYAAGGDAKVFSSPLLFVQFDGRVPASRVIGISEQRLASGAFEPRDVPALDLRSGAKFILAPGNRLYRVALTEAGTISVAAQGNESKARVLGEEVLRARAASGLLARLSEAAREAIHSALQPLVATSRQLAVEFRGSYQWTNGKLEQEDDALPRYFMPAQAYYGEPVLVREIAAYRHDLARSAIGSARASTLLLLSAQLNRIPEMQRVAKQIASADVNYTVEGRREFLSRRFIDQDVEKELSDRQVETRRGVLDLSDSEVSEGPSVKLRSSAPLSDVPLGQTVRTVITEGVKKGDAPVGGLRKLASAETKTTRTNSPIEQMVISVYGLMHPVNTEFMRRRHEAALREGKTDIAYMAYDQFYERDVEIEQRALRTFAAQAPMASMIDDPTARAKKVMQSRRFELQRRGLPVELTESQVIDEMAARGLLPVTPITDDDEELKPFASMRQSMKGVRGPVAIVYRALDDKGQIIPANRLTAAVLSAQPDKMFVLATDSAYQTLAEKSDVRLGTKDMIGAENVLPYPTKNIIGQAAERDPYLGWAVHTCPVCKTERAELCWDLEKETPRKMKMTDRPHDQRFQNVEVVPNPPDGVSPEQWKVAFVEFAPFHLEAQWALRILNAELMEAERQLTLAKKSGDKSSINRAAATLSQVKNAFESNVRLVQAKERENLNRVAETYDISAEALKDATERQYGQDAVKILARARLQEAKTEVQAVLREVMARGVPLVMMDNLDLIDLRGEGKEFRRGVDRVELLAITRGPLAAARTNRSRIGAKRRYGHKMVAARKNPALFPEYNLFYQCVLSGAQVEQILSTIGSEAGRRAAAESAKHAGFQDFDINRYLLPHQVGLLDEGILRLIAVPIPDMEKARPSLGKVYHTPVGTDRYFGTYLGNFNLPAFTQIERNAFGLSDETSVKEREELPLFQMWSQYPDSEMAVLQISKQAPAKAKPVPVTSIALPHENLFFKSHAGKDLFLGAVPSDQGSRRDVAMPDGSTKVAISLGSMSFQDLISYLGRGNDDVLKAGLAEWNRRTGLPITQEFIAKIKSDTNFQKANAQLVNFLRMTDRPLPIYALAPATVSDETLVEGSAGINQARSLLQYVMAEAGLTKPIGAETKTLVEVWDFLYALAKMEDEEREELLKSRQLPFELLEAAGLTNNEGAKLPAPFALVGSMQVNLTRLAMAAPQSPRPLVLSDTSGLLNFSIGIPTNSKTMLPIEYVIRNGASNESQGFSGIRAINLPMVKNVSIATQLVLCGFDRRSGRITSTATNPNRKDNLLSFAAVESTETFQESLKSTVLKLWQADKGDTPATTVGQMAYYQMLQAFARGGKGGILKVSEEAASRRETPSVDVGGSRSVTVVAPTHRSLAEASKRKNTIFYAAATQPELTAVFQQKYPNNPDYWAESLINQVQTGRMTFIVIPDDGRFKLTDGGVYMMQVGGRSFRVTVTAESSGTQKFFRLDFEPHEEESDGEFRKFLSQMMQAGVRPPRPVMTYDEASDLVAERELSAGEVEKAIEIELAKDKLRYLEQLKEKVQEYNQRDRKKGQQGYVHQATTGLLSETPGASRGFVSRYLSELAKPNSKYGRAPRSRRSRSSRNNPLAEESDRNAVIDYAKGKVEQRAQAEAALQKLTEGRPASSWELNKETVSTFFPREGAERPSDWLVDTRFTQGLRPDTGRDLVSRAGRVAPTESAGTSQSGEGIPYSEAARGFTQADAFYQKPEVLPWIARNAEMSIDEAVRVIDDQKAKVERRGKNQGRISIQAASAVCKMYRRRRLSNFEIPDPVMNFIQNQPGGIDNSLVILMSPKTGAQNQPLAIPRVMTWRRGDHIDCDMVGSDPGDMVELLGKSIQSALYWIAEKFDRRGEGRSAVTVYVARVGESGVSIAWKPGDKVSIEQVTQNLQSKPQPVTVEAAVDIAKFLRAEEAYNAGNFKPKRGTKTRAAPPPRQQQTRTESSTTAPPEPPVGEEVVEVVEEEIPEVESPPAASSSTTPTISYVVASQLFSPESVPAQSQQAVRSAVEKAVDDQFVVAYKTGSQDPGATVELPGLTDNWYVLEAPRNKRNDPTYWLLKQTGSENTYGIWFKPDDE